MSAKILIDNGADVNAFSNLGKTPLHFAAMNNHLPLLKILMLEYADMRIKDDSGCVPLHLACKKGSQDAVKFLLVKGVKGKDIYAVDHRMWTPLHYAAYNGHPRVCEILLEFDVDFDPKLRDAKNS